MAGDATATEAAHGGFGLEAGGPACPSHAEPPEEVLRAHGRAGAKMKPWLMSFPFLKTA